MAFDTWAIRQAPNSKFVVIRYDSSDTAMWSSEPLLEKDAVELLEEIGVKETDILQALESTKRAVA